jgi:hypothetical protein
VRWYCRYGISYRDLKQLIRPLRGFKTLKTPYATIMGFEDMRALRKDQAAIFNLTQDIRGEARIVERAFGSVPVCSRRPSHSSAKALTSNWLDVSGRKLLRRPRQCMGLHCNRAA